MSLRYILFNKPYGVLSQFTGQDQQTLADFGLPAGVYPVGRLDKDSEGLLLLSNDGPFIKRFLDSHPRIYWAQVEKIPTQAEIDQLQQGVTIKSGLTRPCLAQLIPEPQLPPRNPPIRFRKNIPTSWLELTLTEGKNRQVRKMTAAIGYPTLRLFRCGLGKLHLYQFPELAPGQWIEVQKKFIV